MAAAPAAAHLPKSQNLESQNDIYTDRDVCATLIAP
jgi:hypothetical protein